jgi:hypothetical protein
MSEALYSAAAIVGAFIVCIVFEMFAKFNVMNSYISPKGDGYVKPSFSLRRSWRHLAVLPVAAFLGLLGRGYKLPYWCAVVFGCFFVVWIGCFFWCVGREISRQKIANRKQDE